MEKLTDREVDAMMAVWNCDTDKVPTGYILKNINSAERNSLQTLQVVLCLLCEKGRQTNLYASAAKNRL